jgi:hypothetical protein
MRGNVQKALYLLPLSLGLDGERTCLPSYPAGEGGGEGLQVSAII